MASDLHHLDRHLRRTALRRGIVNGALWSIGNGLTTGTLIIYLAQELGARGLAISAILSLQSLFGVLRLAAPGLIGRLGGPKRTAISFFLLSYLLLCALPLTVLYPWGNIDRLVAFVSLICVHQLLEHLGTVALWAWLAELVPQPMRGRYFALRTRWQLLVLIPTVALARMVFRPLGTLVRSNYL